MGEGAAAFVVDQLLHFVTIVVAACWIVRVGPAGVLRHGLSGAARASDRVLLLLVVYVAVIFGGGYLIRFMTRPLLKHLQGGESHAQLGNAGMYIGWLERFLVMTALILHSPATVGLILAAKSIARYPEFKREQFAEYFLIGTLLSISAATVGRSHTAESVLRNSRCRSKRAGGCKAVAQEEVCQLHCRAAEVECGAF